MADDLGTVLAVPVDHDPWAVPKPGQTVPATPDQYGMSREAAQGAVSTLRPYWMDLDPTDREILERSNAMQTGQTQPGKVLPTTGMNPVPFAMLDAASMLPAGGLAKFASGLLGIGAKRALGAAAEAGAGAAERGVAGAAAEAAPAGIRAYHSSPHDFEQFDLSKIGTGEGAQSYGHGIYVAENPAVSGQGGEYWNQFLNKFSGPEREVAERLKAANFDRKAAAGDLGEEMAWLEYNAKHASTPEAAAKHTNMLEALQRLESGQPVGPRTYEVNIGARPEHFLDWDKPLSEQHPEVKSALRTAVQSSEAPNVKMLRDLLETDKAWDVPASDQFGQWTGERIYRRMGEREGAATGTDVLRQAGIPGIKYLDQGSRTTSGGELIDTFKDAEGWKSKIRMNRPNGEQYFTTSMAHPTEDAAKQWAQSKIQDQGTRNYVVFDPKMIEIMRKYGIAAGMLGGGAAASQYPLPFQPEAQ